MEAMCEHSIPKSTGLAFLSRANGGLYTDGFQFFISSPRLSDWIASLSISGRGKIEEALWTPWPVFRTNETSKKLDSANYRQPSCFQPVSTLTSWPFLLQFRRASSTPSAHRTLGYSCFHCGSLGPLCSLFCSNSGWITNLYLRLWIKTNQ